MAMLGPQGLHRNEVRFCLQHLLLRFTISGRSCHQNFGSWIVNSRTGRVKHEPHVDGIHFLKFRSVTSSRALSM
jgi:hypothetical protein